MIPAPLACIKGGILGIHAGLRRFFGHVLELLCMPVGMWLP